MAKRDTHTQAVMKSGQDLLDSGHYSSDTIQSRMTSIQNKWTSLHDVAGYRKRKIQENLQLQQFIADYNDIMSWLDMMERIVANDDLGYDEASAETLLKKHKVKQMITFCKFFQEKQLYNVKENLITGDNFQKFNN